MGNSHFEQGWSHGIHQKKTEVFRWPHPNRCINCRGNSPLPVFYLYFSGFSRMVTWWFNDDSDENVFVLFMELPSASWGSKGLAAAWGRKTDGTMDPWKEIIRSMVPWCCFWLCICHASIIANEMVSNRSVFTNPNERLASGFKHVFYFYPDSLGKSIQFDDHMFQMGWINPPTRWLRNHHVDCWHQSLHSPNPVVVHLRRI